MASTCEGSHALQIRGVLKTALPCVCVVWAAHLMSRLEGMITDWLEFSMPRLMDGKTFQKRRVSSPAPVTMFYPQGLMDR